MTTGHPCATCGAWHDTRPSAFIADMPLVARLIATSERGKRVDLRSDACVVDGRHFFILGNLDLRVVGRDETIRWSVWSSVSEAQFAKTGKLSTTAGREKEPPYFGNLASHIPGYPPTDDVPLVVRPNPVGVRPTLDVLACANPLYVEQRDGISPERAEALIHAALASDIENDDAKASMQTLREAQQAICKRFGAAFLEPDLGAVAGIARNVGTGVLPINAERHHSENGSSGWFIYAGDLEQREDFFAPMHLGHIAERFPAALPYLGLPAGWRFQIDDRGYEDVWEDQAMLDS